MKLKSVRVRDAVPFKSVSTVTLSYTDGVLEFDEETSCILATPNKTGSLTKALVIPLGNVVYFEILDEKMAAAAEKLKAATAELPPPPPRPVVDDTIRLQPKGK